MRALVGWVLALSLIASPALAAGSGAADSTGAATNNSATNTAKDDSGSTPSATAKADASSLETEIGDLRDLIDSQANQLEKQNDQLQQEQKKLETLEEQLKASNTARNSVTSSAPASSSVTTASVAIPTVPAASSSSSSPSPAPAALPQQGNAPPPSPLFFKIGVANFTPLGFIDTTDVMRVPSIGSGIGTNFAQVPYRIPANFPSSGLSENRISLQNSRIGIRIDAPIAGGQAIGYLETDFLGNAPTNLSTTSNSAVLRLRVFFLDYTKDKWEFLAGQDWSMLTPNRVGINPIPGNIFFSQDVDTNYQVGLVWERVPQFRFIYHASKAATFGVSLENADQYLGVNGGAGEPVIPGPLAGTTAFNVGQFDTGTSATNIPNVFTDVIVKAAFDPMVMKRNFHFEVSGLYKTFRANTFMPPASGNSGGTSINNTVSGGAVSANINLEAFKNFHLIANSYWSDGGGQKIFDLAPDVVIHPQANATSPFTIAPLHSGSGIGGAEWQALPKLGFYGYYGAVYISRDSFPCGASFCGYGVPASATGLTGATGTEGQNRVIQEGTFGFIPVFVRSPNYGTIQLMTQFSYLSRAPWTITAGAPKVAHGSMLFVNLRYVLP